MTVLFDIALAVVSTTSTLAAFGGKTTRDGPEPMLQRINSRGKLSLVCLFLTLSLGITKGYETSQENKTKAKLEAADKAKDAAEAEARQAILRQKLTEANAKADLASSKLEELQKTDQLTQDRLQDARTTLDDVHGTLNATKSYLNESSSSNLVATLANEGATVSDVMIAMPLTKAAKNSAHFRDALLPRFENRECTDITGLTVSMLTNAKSVVTIYYPPGDAAAQHDYFDDLTKKKDSIVAVPRGGGESLLDFNLFTGQRTTNGILYTAIFHLAGHSISAAQLYSVLAKPNAEVFGISSTWPTVFSTRASLDHAEAAYPEVYKGKGNLAHLNQGVNDGTDSKTVASYPSGCAASVRRYFAHAFERATLFMLLEQKQNEMISVRLNAGHPKLKRGMWYVPFIASGAPRVQAFGDAINPYINLKWTADGTKNPNP